MRRFWVLFQAFWYGVFHPFLTDAQREAYARREAARYMARLTERDILDEMRKRRLI